MDEPTDLPLPPPQQVLLRHSEVMGAALRSSSRVRGGGTWFTAILLVLLCLAVWAGHLATFWLVQRLPFAAMFALGPYLPVVIPALFALFCLKLAIDVEQWRAQRAYLSVLAARGIPLERTGTYHVTAEALVLRTERIDLSPRWEAIDQVERGAKGWVISADQLHLLIPFADFADPETERGLLAAITARMTPDARTRSREAIEFASAPPSPAADPSPAAAAGPETLVAERSPPPCEASGWLTQEQAGWAGSVVYAKVARPGFHSWAYPLTGAVTGLVVGMLVVGILGLLVPGHWMVRSPMLAGLSAFALPLLGGALGLAYANRRLGIQLAKAWRGGLALRGVPDQVEARWTLTDTGLAYHTARFSGEAAYGSLHQLLHEGGYWIVGADALTLCIPNTAFASPGEANGFMTQLLGQMSEPARDRSVRLTALAHTAER